MSTDGPSPAADLAFDLRATLAVRAATAILARLLPPLPDGSPALLGRLPTPGLHLTYDDGPHPATTPALLDALGDRPATFFLLADAVRAHPALPRRIADAGHGLGLHGPTHADPWRTRTDVPTWSDAARHLEDAAGAPLVALRPPYGHITPALAAWARRRCLPVWLWDVMPGDFRPGISADAVARTVWRWQQPGSVVVLHEGSAVANVSVGVTRRLLDLGK